MLIPTLGAGHVRARAAVTMATEEVHETDESYDPNQQVLRSQQTSSDKSVNTESSPSTTVGNNLPNANANQDNKTGSTNDREEETNNYEIGKRVRVVNQSRPRIARVSMAVLVDGTMAKDKSGKEVWTPLDDSELQRITTLAQTAVGFDKARGDEVRVVSMRFMPDGGFDFAGSRTDYFSREMLIYVAEWVIPILLVLGACLLACVPCCAAPVWLLLYPRNGTGRKRCSPGPKVARWSWVPMGRCFLRCCWRREPWGGSGWCSGQAAAGSA